MTLWPPQDFEAFTDRILGSRDPLSEEYRGLSRFYAGNSFDSELDSAGRVMLNPKLMAHAGIEKDVVVVGNIDHLEVWDRKAWADHQRELDEGVRKVTGGVGHPG